jgi:hypothetical protein
MTLLVARFTQPSAPLDAQDPAILLDSEVVSLSWLASKESCESGDIIGLSQAGLKTQSGRSWNLWINGDGDAEFRAYYLEHCE